MSFSLHCPAGRAATAPRRSCASPARLAPPRAASLADFETFVRDTQTRLCDSYAALDGSGESFLVDAWSQDGAGGASSSTGVTRVLSGGSLWEKAAVNVSSVKGVLSATRAASMSARGGRSGVDPAGGQPYSAVALSLVLHGASPLVPTFRADVRAFAVGDVAAWLGGGADLTPSYLFEEDVRHFHTTYAALCAAHEAPVRPAGTLFSELKAATDEYFYLPARGEHRGVGGVFFDDFPLGAAAADAGSAAPRNGFDFARSLAQAWLPSYEPICTARRHAPFTDAQRRWQLQRRGRYLEFNLLYDRGVRFGLDGGRIESIMVSAPPLVRWDYNAVPEEGSEEWRLLQVLKAPRSWV
jgi:coproporphyrinogen III oxidase